MGRVVHFEIAADDVARAIKFYEIFGWKIENSNMPGMEYFLAKTGDSVPGIDGAIMPRAYSAQPVRNTIAVDDIDEMIEKVKNSGGQVTDEKNMIPGIGYYVNAVDSEGNTFGMLEAIAPSQETVGPTAPTSPAEPTAPVASPVDPSTPTSITPSEPAKQDETEESV